MEHLVLKSIYEHMRVVLQITHDDNNKKYDSFFKRENG